MFKRMPEWRRAAPARSVSLTFEGRTIAAREGDTVAAAVLAAGAGHTRTTPVSAARRAPYCMMGVCFECLMQIDGVNNQQACMVPVREGMQVSRQLGPSDLAEAGRIGVPGGGDDGSA